MNEVTLTWFGEPLDITDRGPNEERIVWMRDTEFGDALMLLKRGDHYALITTDMETGSARYFHTVVRFPENGEWERIDGDNGIAAFNAIKEGGNV